MCGYQGYEFGAGSYPDSVCIDGVLFDADACDVNGNLFDTERHIPCPMCRPAEAIEYWTEQNSSSWEDDEDQEDEAAHDARARAAAVSLVTDIRRNRGVEFIENHADAAQAQQSPAQAGTATALSAEREE